MSVRIQHACLKQQTWLFRRNYPIEMQANARGWQKRSSRCWSAGTAHPFVARNCLREEGWLKRMFNRRPVV